jgi:anti-anti-sigma factor
VTVEGEIDASNSRDLGQYVERELRPTTQLLMDLRAVEFFGAPAFSTLHFIAVCCSRRDVDWVLVGGRDVGRLLGILDPDHVLPLADDFGLGVRAPRTSRLPALSDTRGRRPSDGTQLTPRPPASSSGRAAWRPPSVGGP